MEHRLPAEVEEHEGVADLRAAVGLVAEKRAAEAIPALQALCQRYPDWPVVRAYLGTAYLQSGLVAEAREELERSIALAPASFICRLRYAELLALLGFHDKAMAQLVVALELEAPDERSRFLATELFRYCRDSAKGIFYRQTAFPKLPRIEIGSGLRALRLSLFRRNPTMEERR